MKNLILEIIFSQKSKKLTLALLWLGLFFCFFLIFNNKILAQTTSPDAIAIRVLPNFEHYSAQYWYAQQGFGGSPQALTVDGYEAVRDGRTVYVNVANVVTGDLYTNIYLISFNQDAESVTRDIFANILSHWKFNTNLTAFGRCRQEGSIICLDDSECPINDFCNSAKASVVRDTRRLSDLARIKITLDTYKTQTGFYPKLTAGTYLPRKTASVWPSWQDALASELGVYVPVDPINKLGPCPGYNEITCWNEETSRFDGAWPDLPNQPALPDSSLVYTYTVNALGSFYNLCMVSESGLNITGDNFCILNVCLDFDGDGYGLPGSTDCAYPETDCDDTDPDIHAAAGPEVCQGGLDEDCDRTIDCADSDCFTDPACTGFGICNQNGICEPARGETCSNCPQDYCCGPPPCPDGYCDEGCGECNLCYGPGLDCECGNGDIECVEECDDGNLVNGDGCSSVCTFAHSPCLDYDGDGYDAIDIACPTGNDCDDNNGNINPGESEICNGLDDDCSGTADDGAGMNEENCGYLCAFNYNDVDRTGDLRCCGDDPGEGPYVAPPEVACSDGQDNDCDGTFDDDISNPLTPDIDCLPCGADSYIDETHWYLFGEADCNQCDHAGDDDGNQEPSAFGLDWETDYPGWADLCDPACRPYGATVAALSPPVHIDEYEASESICTGGVDNDCDGLIDGDDPDCCTETCTSANEPNCQTADPGNTQAGAGVCCTTGESCYACLPNHTWDGSTCVPNCVVTCAAANEPNCRAADPGNTQAGAGVCCGAGESCYACLPNHTWDGSTCVPNCVVTCTAANEPNCQIIAPANSQISTDVCCTAGESCYICQAGAVWNPGSSQCEITCYRDADSDGFGDPNVSAQFAICPGIGDHVANNTDCNDDPLNGGAFSFPGNPTGETCDGYDNECNGQTDEGCDDDSDGYCDINMQWFNTTTVCPNTLAGPMGDDCDDNPAACGADCNPGIADEIPNSTCSDTYDNDCDGNVDCTDTPACDTDPSCTNNCVFPFIFPCIFP